MARRVSVTKALVAGVIVVNLPVLVWTVSSYIVAFFVITDGGLSGWRAFALPVLLVAFGSVAGWAWWAFTLPRWRVWALERVRDRESLVREAVRWQLMWPPGHDFEDTEVRSERLDERERAVGWERRSDGRAV